MYYKAFRETLNSKPKMIPVGTDIIPLIKDMKDYYQSLYMYNEAHKQQIETNNSVSGIKDTVTNCLFWDFDSIENLEQARRDSVNLVESLIRQGLTKENIDVYFTGSKGFCVKVLFKDLLLNPVQFRSIVTQIASSLPTFDKVVNDANRVIRIPNTIHPDTKLYKVQLQINELQNLSIEQIRVLASKPRSIVKPTLIEEVPMAINKLIKASDQPKKIEVDLTASPDAIDFADNKLLTNCRFSLQAGAFKQGERNTALMCLAASYKNMGYKEELTYRLLKGVAELQAKRHKCDRYPDAELYNNIVKLVYSNTWNNGQYSCRTKDTWLANYCQQLGDHSCDATKKYTTIVDLNTALTKFKQYATDIDKNTIKTGIEDLDRRTRITTGQHIAILGAPSSGKSSLALQILENTSLSNVNSIFFCLDMSDTTTIEKLYQKTMRKNPDHVYSMVKAGKEKETNATILDRYKNVQFCFRNNLTIDNIRDIIIEEQKKQHGNLKLIVIDYAGRVLGPWSDLNANSAIIANGLRSIANELNVCVITLVQPPKSAGDARDELFSMRQIKGSSVMEESIDKLFAVFRPGFNPMNDGVDDKYMTIPLLKNRQGGLFCLNFRWDGLTGSITPLETVGELEEIKNLIGSNRDRSKKDNGWGD